MLNFRDWNSLRIRISSADIPGFLTKCAASGIYIKELSREDYFTVIARILDQSYPDLQKIARKANAKITVISRSGTYLLKHNLGKRSLLIISVLLLTMLTIYLPTRIFFISVHGNQKINSIDILNAASECGISFGCSRREIRSEQAKNRIIEKCPQLQWVGINTHGCVADIEVTEKAASDLVSQPLGISHMIAKTDGVITTCTATKGTLLCAPGQAVIKGQPLISGFEDLGLCVRSGLAEGEVFGSTAHRFHIVSPLYSTKRQEKRNQFREYSIRFGKKEINLCKGSGILPAGCVKMYREYELLLPGGFLLPLSLIVRTSNCYETEESKRNPETAETNMIDYAQSYLLKQMIAGQIVNSQYKLLPDDKLLTLFCSYSCHEMLGQIVYEEIFDQNGKNN